MAEAPMQADRSLELREQFTYHSPDAGQIERMRQLREKAFELAQLIDISLRPSADKSAAIRKLRECVMTANAGIVLERQEPPGAFGGC